MSELYILIAEAAGVEPDEAHLDIIQDAISDIGSSHPNIGREELVAMAADIVRRNEGD